MGPVSVPDPLAVPLIACLRDDERGPALSDIEFASGRFDLEEHDADTKVAAQTGRFLTASDVAHRDYTIDATFP